MKKAPYMADNEMREYMWLSAMRQMLERIISTTKDKEWLKRLRTMNTNADKLINERALEFNEKEKKKAWRRITNTAIKVYSYDDAKVDKEDMDRTYTISQSDFYDLLDAAALNCLCCAQGEYVKDCPRRALFHRLGLQVHELRENPKEGECEFRCDNDQRAVTPQYKRKQIELIAHLP